MPPAITKTSGSSTALQVDELSVKGASVAVERALRRHVAIRDPLKDAAAVHRRIRRQALLGNGGIAERTPTARTRKGVFHARSSRDIVAQEAKLACKAVRAAQDLAVDDDTAADARADSEHHAKTRPVQSASRILTECTALTVVIDGNRHPQSLAHELSERTAIHKRERTTAMDRSCDISLVDAAGRTHAHGGSRARDTARRARSAPRPSPQPW